MDKVAYVEAVYQQALEKNALHILSTKDVIPVHLPNKREGAPDDVYKARLLSALAGEKTSHVIEVYAEALEKNAIDPEAVKVLCITWLYNAFIS